MGTNLLGAIRISLVLLVICGLGYNLLVTGIAQAIMPSKADGSLIYGQDGKIIGSELIGQTYTDLSYFQGRVSSIDNNGACSGTPNFAPSHPDLKKRVEESLEEWTKNNPEVPVTQVPVDLITNSGSGLDPHISPESAHAQVPRIAAARHIEPQKVNALIDDYVEEREMGIFGEPRVNVLKLNLALDQLK
ncbi:potassium-transporting ATPase subunit KdpC [Brevibacillus centrosporus]|uniref:potassium-transporting ATPase subunit KdpC n=1 Tax=Brevibacillus centrosporus TaxID=54910 RepID=UPI0037F48032